MISIRSPRPDGPEEEPLGLLRRDLHACHERIRRFTEVAGRIARAELGRSHDIADGARALVDYFERALPLHVADEDESIRPRLGALVTAEPLVERALERMHAEHGPLEALVVAGVARWRRLVATPQLLGELRGDLAELARALELGFARHLLAEEAEVFPALVRLSDDDVVGIRREMRRRRAAISTP